MLCVLLNFSLSDDLWFLFVGFLPSMFEFLQQRGNLRKEYFKLFCAGGWKSSIHAGLRAEIFLRECKKKPAFGEENGLETALPSAFQKLFPHCSRVIVERGLAFAVSSLAGRKNPPNYACKQRRGGSGNWTSTRSRARRQRAFRECQRMSIATMIGAPMNAHDARSTIFISAAP